MRQLSVSSLEIANHAGHPIYAHTHMSIVSLMGLLGKQTITMQRSGGSGTKEK